MNSGSSCRWLLLISLFCMVLSPASGITGDRQISYSFIHISDTQSLASNYPETYNLTFSYIESFKDTCNISAIILTGDVINTWNNTRDWDAYLHARNLTTIPVYEIAGNHDTGGGDHYRYYTENTGMPRENYVTSMGDFDLIGINYIRDTYSPAEFLRLRGNLTNSTRSHAIIATHYYMNDDGSLSSLGRDIDTFLIVKPSLVLMGHMHGNFIMPRTVGGFPTVADMTNYQDGIPGGTTGWDYSAGTLYTVTSVNGRIDTITARIMHIYPDPSFEKEITVFSRYPGFFPEGFKSPAAEKPSPGNQILSCGAGNLVCNAGRFFQQIWTDITHTFS